MIKNNERNPQNREFKVPAMRVHFGCSRAPKKDDISICIKCASYNMFNEDLTLRVMTEEDINNIDPETIAHMQRFSDEIKKMNDVNKS